MLNANNQTATNNNQRPDAYLNLAIKMKDGSTRRIPRGIALYINKQIDRSLINAHSANEEIEFELVGSVQLTASVEEESVDLEFA